MWMGVQIVGSKLIVPGVEMSRTVSEPCVSAMRSGGR